MKNSELKSNTDEKPTEKIEEKLGKEKKEMNKQLLKVLDNEKESNIKTEYLYKDSEGEDYLKVVRHNSGEKFGIMHYDTETKEYKYGRGDLEFIPYHLEDLIKDSRNVVFITNGEKDADTLEQLGFLATTALTASPYKWKSSYSTYLKGKYVIILEDNTEEARNFAENTEKKVCYSAKKVARLEITDLAEALNVKVKYNFDITKVRESLQDDEKLKKVLLELKKEIEEVE